MGNQQAAKHRVVILGGGFGGLAVAKQLRRADAQVTLIDRCNYHLFQPLLYQVATGGLSPANIASPLRWILKRQTNTQVLLAEVTGFDCKSREVLLSDGSVPYDTLVVATGAKPFYFGKERWEEISPGLKTIEDATSIRSKLLMAFEAAEREKDPQRIKEWMTFVIVGGGPTGVELAGSIAEISRDTLRHDFRSINPADARIILVESNEHVLAYYPDFLAFKAQNVLTKLGVELVTSSRAVDIGENGAVVRSKVTGEESFISCRTVLWAAGVQASSLGRKLCAQVSAEEGYGGRVLVDEYCNVPGSKDIYVIGDLAQFPVGENDILPGVAAVAQQQGTYVGRRIGSMLRSNTKQKPFRYKDKGSMATIGRAAAVVDLDRIKLWGMPGWLAWLFVHILLLIDFENRVQVTLQWAWNYLTRNRSARLITGTKEVPKLGAANMEIDEERTVQKQ